MDDTNIDKLEESFDNHNVDYKDKLTETKLMPITKRIDRNLIIIAAEALSGRLRFSKLGLKPDRPGRRSGPVAEISFKKAKKRPRFAQRFLSTCLQSLAAELFNATSLSV